LPGLSNPYTGRHAIIGVGLGIACSRTVPVHTMSDLRWSFLAQHADR
jgi:hypothetical protein